MCSTVELQVALEVVHQVGAMAVRQVVLLVAPMKGFLFSQLSFQSWSSSAPCHSLPLHCKSVGS
jgi:hypothetical protein